MGKFCALAFLIPESPATALLWIALMPFSKQELKEKLPTDYNATNCPQVPVSLGAHGARAKRISMMVREREKDSYGYGCFPLLETLFPGQPALPNSTDLKEALFAFMRKVEGHNNRGGNTIVRAVGTPADVAKVDPLPHLWPALSVELDDDEGDEGKHLSIYIALADHCQLIRSRLTLGYITRGDRGSSICPPSQSIVTFGVNSQIADFQQK